MFFTKFSNNSNSFKVNSIACPSFLTTLSSSYIFKSLKSIQLLFLENLLKRSPNSYGKYESAVAEILLNIKTRKDEALFEYTKNFDKADIGPDNIVVTEEEVEEAYKQVDPELVDVIRKAIVNIRSFHEKQKQNSWFDA